MKKKVLSIVIFVCLAVVLTLGLGLTAYADGLSISSAVSYTPTNQLFYVSGCEEGAFAVLYNLQTGKESTMLVSDGELLLDPYNEYDVTVINPSTGDAANAVSTLAHTYTVSYVLNISPEETKTITVESDRIYMGEEFSSYADEVYVDGGLEYVIAEGETATQRIFYGESNYKFNYVPYIPEDIFAYVDYVDDRGNLLQSNEITIGYYSEGEVFTAAPTLEFADGRTYHKIDGADEFSFNYFSPVLDYEVIYAEDTVTQSYPYTVKINYINDSGNLLGYQYETITDKMHAAYDSVTAAVPAEYAVRISGSVYYYSTADTEVEIPTDGSVKSIDVSYVLFDNKAPYNWTIRCIDSESNTVLKTVDVIVGVDAIAHYDAETMIEYNGSAYILDNSLETSYDREYSDSSVRTLNLYYHQEGAVVASSKTATVTFISVSNDIVIREDEIEVPVSSVGTVDLPDYITFGATTYVKLGGQGAVLEVPFWSPQEQYLAYYRDVNDLQNVDTIVIEQIGGGMILDNGNGVAIDTNAEANLENGVGTIEIEEEEVPLAGGAVEPANDEIVIADEEVPLAGGEEKTGSMTYAIIGAAAVAVIAAAAFITMKKRAA